MFNAKTKNNFIASNKMISLALNMLKKAVNVLWDNRTFSQFSNLSSGNDDSFLKQVSLHY